MKVTNIYDILKSLKNDIIVKQNEIENLEKYPDKLDIIKTKKSELNNLNNLFNSTISNIRQDKIRNILKI
jgi:hypothetical protein